MPAVVPLDALVAGLAPIVLIVVVGRVMRLTVLPRAEQWAAADKLAFNVLIPCLIAGTLSRADFGGVALGAFGLSLAATLTVAIIALACLYPLFSGRERDRIASYTSIFQTATRWNAFIALAVVAELYGGEAVAMTALGMVVLMPIVNIVNVAVLTRLLTEEKVSLAALTIKILTNPIIVGCLVGIGLNLTGSPLWTPAMDAVEVLGRASFALVLLSVGAGLSFAHAAARPGDVVLSSVLKLAAMPAVALAIALAIGLEGLALSVAVLIAATPTASNGYVLAKEMGGDAPLYANATSAQVLLSLLTIPLWLAIVSLVGGA